MDGGFSLEVFGGIMYLTLQDLFLTILRGTLAVGVGILQAKYVDYGVHQ